MSDCRLKAYSTNRAAAIQDGSQLALPSSTDTYSTNLANEYTALTRNNEALTVDYDRAGNMTAVPVLPATGEEGQPDVTAAARWDANVTIQSYRPISRVWGEPGGNSGLLPHRNYWEASN